MLEIELERETAYIVVVLLKEAFRLRNSVVHDARCGRVPEKLSIGKDVNIIMGSVLKHSGVVVAVNKVEFQRALRSGPFIGLGIPVIWSENATATLFVLDEIGRAHV